MILLDGQTLTLDGLTAIAHGRAPAALAPAAVDRVRRARAIVDRHAAGTAPVYGINTGFGSLAEVAIPRDKLSALQVNLLRSHASGIGEPLPVPAVRATMALRANVLAKGFSGIRLETLEALVAALNAGVHPRVPSRGSVGASGDLAPLAHLALVLIGEGDAIADDGSIIPGLEALRRAGLAPVALGAKEGLALINGTQPSAALLALSVAAAILPHSLPNRQRTHRNSNPRPSRRFSLRQPIQKPRPHRRPLPNFLRRNSIQTPGLIG